MNLTFTGGREFAAFLQKLPGVISADILETSLNAGAQIIQASARDKCPKPAQRRRPGTVRLADSIRFSTVEKDAAHAIVHVGTRVPYAHLVEFGHQIVSRGPTKRRISVTRVSAKGRVSARLEVEPGQKHTGTAGGFVAARPFLRPAFDENREAVVNRIGQVMGKQIEVVARRLAEETGSAQRKVA